MPKLLVYDEQGAKKVCDFEYDTVVNVDGKTRYMINRK